MKNLRLKSIAFLTVIMFAFAMLLQCCRQKPEPPKQVIVKDTIIYTPEMAVDDMLEMQADAKYNYRLDSVFRTMDKEIITRIMLKHPDWCIEQLVTEYIINKENYDIDKSDYDDIRKYQKSRQQTKIVYHKKLNLTKNWTTLCN